MADDQNKKNKDILLAWSFFELPQYERGRSWYMWGAIISFLLVIYAVFTKNPLFALIIVIFALIFLLFQRNNREIEFSATKDGITVGRQFYEYDRFKNFYVIYRPPEVKTLYFEPKNALIPRIPIPLDSQNPVKIREVLLKYLAEDLDRENEPTSDQFSRMFKL